MIDSLRAAGITVLYRPWDLFNDVAFPTEASRDRPAPPGPTIVPIEQPSYVAPGYITWYPFLKGRNCYLVDASIFAVGKYLGIRDTESPKCYSDRVEYGSLTIPFASGASAMSAISLTRQEPVLSVSAIRFLDQDHLEFQSADTGRNNPHRAYPGIATG